MSEVCDAFGIAPCPGAAQDQDYELVSQILDYRNAKLAISVFNQPDRKQAVEQFKANPELARILTVMHRAQEGSDLDSDDVEAEGLRIAMTYRDVDSDDEDQPAADTASIADAMPDMATI